MTMRLKMIMTDYEWGVLKNALRNYDKDSEIIEDFLHMIELQEKEQNEDERDN